MRFCCVFAPSSRGQVNYLSHALLTELLLPALKASAPSRVVHVSSEAHRLGAAVQGVRVCLRSRVARACWCESEREQESRRARKQGSERAREHAHESWQDSPQHLQRAHNESRAASDGSRSHPCSSVAQLAGRGGGGSLPPSAPAPHLGRGRRGVCRCARVRLRVYRIRVEQAGGCVCRRVQLRVQLRVQM